VKLRELILLGESGKAVTTTTTQTWLGHSTFQMTMDIYSACIPSMDDSAIEIMDSVFEEVGKDAVLTDGRGSDTLGITCAMCRPINSLRSQSSIVPCGANLVSWRIMESRAVGEKH